MSRTHVKCNFLNRFRRKSSPDLTIEATKPDRDELAVVWSLSNPGPYTGIAEQITQKHIDGFRKNIEMVRSPEDCFKLAITQFVSAPADADIFFNVEENMAYTAFWIQ
jgi:hypothetical protein